MNIGFIGFGEVGREMSIGLSKYDVDNIYAFDPLQSASEPSILSEKTSLTFFQTIEELSEQSLDILFVAVPANKALEVWESIYNTLKEETIYIDLTTASAQEKKDVNEKMKHKGTNIIDGAILGALKVYQNAVPILVSGKDSNKFIERGKSIGMNITYLSEHVGDATNFKFIRSIFTKGLSTLLYEVMETAEKLGLEQEIFDSITKTMDKDPFDEIVNRYIKSNVPHSERREKEMDNVIDFMQSNNLVPHMTYGTRQKLEDISSANLNDKLGQKNYDWKEVIKEYNNR